MAENKIVYAGRTYVHDDIKSGGCHLACSLIAEELSIDTLEADVRSSDTSLTSFTRGAPLKYYHGSALIAKFYVSDIERTAVDLYRISATSALGLLNEREHLGGMYTGQTAAEILADLMPAEVQYTVTERIGRVKMYGWLPIAPIRDNLLQVLFALGANLLKDGNGDLVVSALSKDMDGDILADRVFPGGSVERLTPATRVEVTEHQYIPGTEATVLYEGTTSPEEIIRFSEPMHSLVASGATVLRSGANYAVLSTGTATLTGKKYTHTQKIVSAVDETAPVGEENTHTVADMTLVSLVNSGSVAERALAYYALKETVTQDIEVGPEKPGNMARMTHPFGGAVLGDIEDMEVTFGRFLRARTALRVGFMPLTPPGNLYENMVVISTSCTWTVPEGCTKIRAVLIGGGQRGNYGLRGANGAATGAGGRGGAGGAGGAGGKILEVVKSVTQGQVFDVFVAAPSGDSKFAGASSANGASLPGGYTEITTGATYGADGASGYQSPDGKSAGSPSVAVYGSFTSGTNVRYSLIEPLGNVTPARASITASLISSTPATLAISATSQAGQNGRAGLGGDPGTNYGDGGCGGSGGEGGAGTGSYALSVSVGSVLHFYSGGIKDDISVARIDRSTGGISSGGAPGAGGEGAQGCVIIYY